MFRSVLRMLLTPKPCAPIRKPAKSALRMETLEDRTVPATFTVGTGAGALQAALNAAASNPGADIVVVPAGTYTELISITDSSAVTLRASGTVTIKAPASAVGGAVINITGKNVTVDGFKVDATGSHVDAAIRVLGGGSATIKNNVVTGTTTPNDPVAGNGIQVGSSLLAGAAGAGTAKVNNNTVSNYQGAGVLVDGGSASASVKGNTITGRGAANGTTSYGVQVSRGATSRVESNTISGNDLGTGGGGTQSAGIYFYQDGGKNSVAAKNNVFGNQDGILVQDSNGSCAGAIEIVNNDVHGNTGYAGIDILRSNNVEVENNDVFSNTGYNGIALTSSTRVEVEGNSVHDNAGDGIYDFAGNTNYFNANDSYSNGNNGIFVEQSTNDQIWNNFTWSNAFNGIKVLGGSSNDIWLGASTCNTLDGILLQDTNANTVVGNALLANGGYGLRLVNADNTFVAYNLFGSNGSGSVSIDANSTGTIQIGNRTNSPPVKDGTSGSGGTCAHYTSAHANADDDCNGLDD